MLYFSLTFVFLLGSWFSSSQQLTPADNNSELTINQYRFKQLSIESLLPLTGIPFLRRIVFNRFFSACFFWDSIDVVKQGKKIHSTLIAFVVYYLAMQSAIFFKFIFKYHFFKFKCSWYNCSTIV